MAAYKTKQNKTWRLEVSRAPYSKGCRKNTAKKEIFSQKLCFKNGDIKIYQDKQKMRKSVVGRPALQEGVFRLK